MIPCEIPPEHDSLLGLSFDRPAQKLELGIPRHRFQFLRFRHFFSPFPTRIGCAILSFVLSSAVISFCRSIVVSPLEQSVSFCFYGRMLGVAMFSFRHISVTDGRPFVTSHQAGTFIFSSLFSFDFFTVFSGFYGGLDLVESHCEKFCGIRSGFLPGSTTFLFRIFSWFSGRFLADFMGHL